MWIAQEDDLFQVGVLDLAGTKRKDKVEETDGWVGGTGKDQYDYVIVEELLGGFASILKRVGTDFIV